MTEGRDEQASTGRVPEQGRRRSERAIENDARILGAALRVLREVGFDGMGMRQVAREAGLATTGALYRRFEDVAELAVWVWTEEAGPAFRSVARRAVALLHAVNPDPAAEDESRAVAERLWELDDALRAAVELLAVAPRVDELEEVIGPDLERLLDEAGAGPTGTPQRRAQVISQISVAAGVAMLGLPGTLPAVEWWRLFSGSIGLAHEDTSVPGPLEPIGVPVPTAPITTPEERIRAAAGEVIARSGVERATLSRIARRAGGTTGMIHQYFPSKDDLVADWVGTSLRALYSAEVETEGSLLASGLMTTDAGRMLATLTLPAHRPLQRTKVELYVAAAHRPLIALALARVFNEQNEVREQRFLAAGMSPTEAALAPAAGRLLDHGTALVAGLTPVGDVDWRLYVQPLLARYIGGDGGGAAHAYDGAP